MIPSTELRLKTMMRAITESIIPALDPKDSLAQEQVGLLMGHINALIQQQGRELIVVEKESEEISDLATYLLSVAEGGKNTQKACVELSQALEQDDYEGLSKSVEGLVAVDDASQIFKEATWDAVLDYSKTSAERGRDWFKPMGF